ncbi:MAG TPA: ornithine carbamoyltransferase [Candidatus Hypogeohydataceae bacterium YC41]
MRGLRHLTCTADLSPQEIEEIFSIAQRLKKALTKGKRDSFLKGKTLALIFEKSSLRTRVSFEVAMHQLGGDSIYLSKHDIELGQREAVKDVAHTISRYVHVVALRTFGQEVIEEMTRYSSVPVINALSDAYHPCQALTDLFTLREKLGKLEGMTLAYVGDANNVARSLACLSARLGVNFRIASPAGYQLSPTFMEEVEKRAQRKAIYQTDDPQEAAKGADVLYTDTWVSMGQENEAEVRRKVFKDYQVNSSLLRLAKERVLVMHCLPAHRGEEITDEVLDGPHSIVFDQAENRLHVQKAILKFLLRD